MLVPSGQDPSDVAASFTLNVYSHMLPREHGPSGDRLASLVFGNRMETVANLPTRLKRASVEHFKCQLRAAYTDVDMNR